MTTDDAGSVSTPGADAGSPSESTEPAPVEQTSPDVLAGEAPPTSEASPTSADPPTGEDPPTRVVAHATAPQHAKTTGGRRAAFRAWRRSRPFPGGLLLILAGIELLAIPLSGVLFKGAIKLVIYIGIGGVFGVLIGVLLIAAGIMLWVNPTHRVFYAVVGIVLGLASFPASNLGGFFIAMLLAIIGGSLAFAWTPVNATPAPAVGGDPAPGDAGGEAAEPGYPGAAPADAGRSEAGLRARMRRGRSVARGHRALAVATMPALLVAGMLGTSAHASVPQAGSGCIPGIICPSGPSSPSPSPSSPHPSPSTQAPAPALSQACPSVSPSPTPTPGPTLTPGPSPSCSPTPTPGGGPSTSASPSPGATGSHSGSGSGGNGGGSTANGGKPGTKTAKNAAAPKQLTNPGLTAPSATSVLDAGSATLTNFAFNGIVNMPVAGGGTQQMMEFTASSATLAGGVTVTVTQGGQNTVTTSPTLGFSSGMTLYATKLCGKLAGIPLCLTPSTVSAVLLSIANLLTGAMPITLTNVTTNQPLALAGDLQTGSLSIGF